MWKKKIILLFPMLLCVTLFCACGEEAENQKYPYRHSIPYYQFRHTVIIKIMYPDIADIRITEG